MATIPKIKRETHLMSEKSLRALERYTSYSGDNSEVLSQLAESYMDAIEEEVKANNPTPNLSFMSWLKRQIREALTIS